MEPKQQLAEVLKNTSRSARRPGFEMPMKGFDENVVVRKIFFMKAVIAKKD